ncbi:adenylate kinase family protein [Desulfurobacterium sp. TC5-1]|uniref:adenylate kinase family protein n=1 Tax=Desulfurobacterium sp. TC5-1 TaxID=1158318 RepID=UPI0003B637D0|nr:adenylate kinase family protein [Desulfurobacterium sp. TC5-1]
MRITITGTPGTGKSTVAQILSRKLSLPLYNLSDLIKKEKLYTSYDEKRDAFIVDIEKLKDFFKEKKDFIAEGLIAHYIPSDVIVILRAKPEVIISRLKERNYPQEKLNENAESERIAFCATEVFQNPLSPVIIHIDTTERKPEEVANVIMKGIKNGGLVEEIDWLEDQWDI